MCPRCKRSKHPLVKTTFRPAVCALRTARATAPRDFTFRTARGSFAIRLPLVKREMQNVTSGLRFTFYVFRGLDQRRRQERNQELVVTGQGVPVTSLGHRAAHHR